MVTQQTISIDQIKIGRRIRKDPGDINALAASIRSRGQLQPVAIDKKKRLIAGWRRLQAMKLLGRRDIACTVLETVDEALKVIIAERVTNVCRMPYTVSEAVAIGRKLETLAPPRAEAGSGSRQTGSEEVNSPTLKREERSRESRKPKSVAARAVGMSRRTYEKAAAVVDAAKTERSVKPILLEMNQTGNVSRAHRKMQEMMNPPATVSPSESALAWQFAESIGSVVDQYISSKPTGRKTDVIVSALRDSLDRVEQDKADH